MCVDPVIIGLDVKKHKVYVNQRGYYVFLTDQKRNFQLIQYWSKTTKKEKRTWNIYATETHIRFKKNNISYTLTDPFYYILNKIKKEEDIDIDFHNDNKNKFYIKIKLNNNNNTNNNSFFILYK